MSASATPVGAGLAATAVPVEMRAPRGATARPHAGPARMPPWLLVGMLALLVGAFTFALAAYRSGTSPDLLADDLIYSSAGRNIAAGHGLTVQGQAFFWQPPLFPVLLAPVAKLTGLAQAGLLDATLQLRLVNAVLAGLTAAVLFLFVRRLVDGRAGMLAAALYATDPYVLSVTRHLYIEPMAMLVMLLALWLTWESLGRWNLRRALALGVLFGIALLTKEIVFFGMAVPALLALRGRVPWRHLGVMLAVALLCYGGYGLWAWLDGDGGAFGALKLHQFERFTGLLRYTGLNAPGHSLIQSLQQNLRDDWSSYALLGVAVPAAVWLWRTRLEGARFLALWYAVSAVLVGFLGLFGTLNPQFFYYLMVPVAAVVGSVVALLVLRGLGRAPGLARRVRLGRVVAMVGGIALVGLLVGHASADYHDLYARQSDNGYSRVVAAIDGTVPRGATIGVPRSMLELLHFAYPDGRYHLLEVVSAGEVRRHGLRWYVMSSKDPQLGDLSRAFYDDLSTHATLRWSYVGATFQQIGLWSVDPSALTGGSTP